MSSASSRARVVLDAERAAANALSRLADVPAGDVRAYLDGLHDTIAWLCDGLATRLPRGTRRPSTSTVSFTALTDQIVSVPSIVDRLRLVNRHQRSVLTWLDQLLLEPLDEDLRAFLEEARVLVGRSVARGDDTIAALDRQREVPREPGTSVPGNPS